MSERMSASDSSFRMVRRYVQGAVSQSMADLPTLHRSHRIMLPVDIEIRLTVLSFFVVALVVSFILK